MNVDTAALRALAKRYALFVPEVPVDTVRALCDGYDEAQRLRALYEGRKADWKVALGERDAARQALAALVADLRALCDRAERNYGGPTGMANLEAWVHLGSLRAVIDRHAPEGAA